MVVFRKFIVVYFFMLSLISLPVASDTAQVQAEFHKLREAAQNIPACSKEVVTHVVVYGQKREEYKCTTSINKVTDVFYKDAVSQTQPADARKDLCNLPSLGLKPISKIVIDDQAFFLGPRIPKIRANDVIVGYNKDKNGCLVPKLFYKSNSEGGWRVTPQVTKDEGFSKGFERHPHHHYVQETKLHRKLIEALENVDEIGKQFVLEDYFNTSIFSDLGISQNLYNTEVDYGDSAKKGNILAEIQKFRPGGFGDPESAGPGMSQLKTFRQEDLELKRDVIVDGVKKIRVYDTFRDLFHSFDKDFEELKAKGFVPDFTSPPIETYQINHTILSAGEKVKDIPVEVFKATFNGKPIKWHMARDSSGRTWIDRIEYETCRVTSYGNCRDVINTGMLTNKPVDYLAQAWRLKDENAMKELPQTQQREAAQGNKRYVDTSPILKELSPIREYIESTYTRRGLKPPPQEERRDLRPGPGYHDREPTKFPFLFLQVKPSDVPVQSTGAQVGTPPIPTLEKMPPVPVLTATPQTPQVKDDTTAARALLRSLPYAKPAPVYACQDSQGNEIFKLTHGSIFGRDAATINEANELNKNDKESLRIKSFLSGNSYVSRTHFLVYSKDQKMYLHQFSTNPTLIDNKKINSREARELPEKTFELAIRKPDNKGDQIIRCSKE